MDELGDMKLDLPSSRGTDRHARKLGALGAAERRPSVNRAVHRVVQSASPSEVDAGSCPTTAQLFLEELERMGLEEPQPAPASQRGHGTSRFLDVYPIHEASSQCDPQSARSLSQGSESATSTANTARQGESTARPPPQPGLSASQQLLLEEAVLQEEGSPAGPYESARRGRASVLSEISDADYLIPVGLPNREKSIDALLQELANTDKEHGDFAQQAQLWTADTRQQPGSRSQVLVTRTESGHDQVSVESALQLIEQIEKTPTPGQRSSCCAVM